MRTLFSYHRTIWLIVSKLWHVTAIFTCRIIKNRATFDKKYLSLWQVNPMTGKPKISTSRRQVMPDINLWPTRFRIDWYTCAWIVYIISNFTNSITRICIYILRQLLVKYIICVHYDVNVYVLVLIIHVEYLCDISNQQCHRNQLTKTKHQQNKMVIRVVRRTQNTYTHIP